MGDIWISGSLDNRARTNFVVPKKASLTVPNCEKMNLDSLLFTKIDKDNYQAQKSCIATLNSGRLEKSLAAQKILWDFGMTCH